MRKLEFETGGKRIACAVPERWDEVSAEQLLALAGLDVGSIDGSEFYARYFGIRREVVDGLDLYALFVLNGLVEQLSVLPDGERHGGLRRFLVPSYVLGGRRFVCPADGLSGMSFQQFMTVDTFFTWYLETDERRFLLQMCSCLYLEEGEDFFELQLEERMKVWGRCDTATDRTDGAAVLRSVLMQWGMVKRWLAGAYPFLFPVAVVQQQTVRGGRKVASNVWLEIFDVLVQDDLTRIDSYRKLACMDVLRILNRRLKNDRMGKG